MASQLTDGEIWRRIHEILEEIWAVPPDDFAELELRTLYPLKAIMHASDCALIVSTRERRPGGVTRTLPARTVTPWSGPERARITEDWLRSEPWQNDPLIRYLLEGRGRVRLVTQCDGHPLPGWDGSATRRLNRELGVGSRLIGVRPLGEDVEVHFLVDRPLGERPFTDEDRAAFEKLVGAFTVPASRIVRSYGLEPGMVGLTPREREVLAHLLTPKSEKEIAQHLGLGRRAAHHHVTSIYRKLGVTSRAGLMARWLAPSPHPGHLAG